jgi:hypothetical protein
MKNKQSPNAKSILIIFIAFFVVFGLSACQKKTANNNTNSATNSTSKAIPANPGLIFAVTPNKGPVAGGTSITLVGEKIQNNIKVFFGDNEAKEVVIKSATEITCKTPAGKKGVVDLRLKSDAGTVTKLEQAFTYE